MTRPRPLSLACLLLLPLTAFAQERHEPPLPIPEKVTITLVADKKEYFLGENVVINFKIENTGDKPFYINIGGDYRGSPRSLRMIVSALGPDHKPAPDPTPNPICFGGRSGSYPVEPNKPYWLHFALPHHADISAPGEYTITAHHDLGWAETADAKIPSASIKLKFILPTAAQAQQVVDDMAARKNNSYTWGEQREPFGDFSVLRLPIYLAPLAKLAAAGNTDAIEGISEINASEATAALVALLESKELPIAIAAGKCLTMRLPDPSLTGDAPARDSMFVDTQSDKRRQLAESWNPKYAAPVRAFAARLVADPAIDPDALPLAGFLYECVGKADDLPLVLKALTAAALTSVKRQWKINEFPAPPPAATEFQRAAAALVKRGAPFTAAPKSAGELVTFSILLTRDASYRPDHWPDTLAAMLASPTPYVRQVAQENIPLPIPDACINAINENMSDPDVGVAYSALMVAARSKDPRFTPAAVAAIRKVKQEWLLSAGDNALWALNAMDDHYRIWIDRLDEPGMTNECIKRLAQLVEGYQGDSSGKLTAAEGRRVKPYWKTFYTQHQKEILAGKKFPPGVITPEFFPDNAKLYIKGLGTWPPPPPGPPPQI